MKWKTAIFRFNFFIQLNSWTNKNFPDLNSEQFQVKFSPISQKGQFLLERLLELWTRQNSGIHVVGKNVKLETFKLESSKWNYLLHWKLSHFKLSNLKVSNFSFFPTAQIWLGTVPSMIIDWVLFWATLFIWLNSIDWIFVLVNWNVHIVGVFSISRTAQGSTNAPRPCLAHIYFCWMDKFVRGTLDLPNVCFSSLSRRGDWLIDVSVEQFFIRTCFEVVVPFESEITWDSGYFQRIYW